jgi:hypothetical protein
MNQTNGVVEMPFAERETGMTRFNSSLHIRLEVVLYIQINYFAARSHDIADYALPQIERIDQKLFPQRADFFRFGALAQDQTQFFLAMNQFSFAGRLDPQNVFQDPVG